MASLAIHGIRAAGREWRNFSNTPVAIRGPCWHSLKALTVTMRMQQTTKFVLGFCRGQLRFCLLVRIGRKEGNLPQETCLSNCTVVAHNNNIDQKDSSRNVRENNDKAVPNSIIKSATHPSANETRSPKGLRVNSPWGEAKWAIDPWLLRAKV